MWPEQARYCPLCGGELSEAEVEGRVRLACPNDKFVLYRNPACASAGLVLDKDRRVLLIRRAIQPFKGDWALPAGYQEIDEEPTDTVRREVREETGLEVEVVRLLDLVFVSRDHRKPANVAIFLCRAVAGRLQAGSDAAEVDWFSLDDLPPNLGFDNRELLSSRLHIPEGPE